MPTNNDLPKGWTQKQFDRLNPAQKRDARNAAKIKASLEQRRAERAKKSTEQAPTKKKAAAKKKTTAKKAPSAAQKAGGTIKKGKFGAGSTRRLGEFGL